MKAQGTDGVSRGQMKEGVSAGLSMMSFIPFHLSALDRSPPIREWITSWLGEGAEFLEPKDWFERGHDTLGGSYDAKGFWRSKFKTGKMVWMPPPAAADVALEELRKARIKRQDSLHVFVVPRLMKPYWFRQLYKTADVVFDVPPGACCWPTHMFEPVVVGLILPYLNRSPWCVRASPKMRAMERKMRKVWDSPDMASGNLLRKFLLEYEWLQSMQGDVVRRVLFFERHRPLSHQSDRNRRGRKRPRPEGETEIGYGLGSTT
jgi:hypothetical protein